MAKLNRQGRDFLKALSKRYGHKITNYADINKYIPQEDWYAYSELDTNKKGVHNFEDLINRMGEGYLVRSSEIRNKTLGNKPPSPSSSVPATPAERAKIKKEAAAYHAKQTPATQEETRRTPSEAVAAALAAATTPAEKKSAEAGVKSAASLPTDGDVFYGITGDKDPESEAKRKTDAEAKAKKEEAGSPLDSTQREAIKKRINSQLDNPGIRPRSDIRNKSGIKDVRPGPDYDSFVAQQLGAIIPEATGQMDQLPRFGNRSNSQALNTYDNLVNTLSAKRSPMQQKIASAAPWATAGANALGYLGGEALGGVVGGPLGSATGAVLGSRGLGDRKSTRLNSSHIPLSRMPSSA